MIMILSARSATCGLVWVQLLLSEFSASDDCATLLRQIPGSTENKRKRAQFVVEPKERDWHGTGIGEPKEGSREGV